MDSIPGATRPMDLGKRFASVFAEASVWQRYDRSTPAHIKSRMGPTGLGISSAGQGGAVVYKGEPGKSHTGHTQ